MTVRILGISGSLRTESNNAKLISLASHCSSSDVEFQIAGQIGLLPHFNPDIDPSVSEDLVRWIQFVRESDGLVISTPEYARGYPGSLKNALDWLVQTDAHIDKPFMMLSAGARSTVARDTLITVLETMSGIHVERASTTISLLGQSTSLEALLQMPKVLKPVTRALADFVEDIKTMQ
jgi:chromate reductase